MKYSLRSLMIGLTLVCVYFGAYSVTLQPVIAVDEGFHGMVASGYREPHFRIGNSVLQVVFTPLVWIDRQVRPNYWDQFSDFDQ